MLLEKYCQFRITSTEETSFMYNKEIEYSQMKEKERIVGRPTQRNVGRKFLYKEVNGKT